MPGLYSAGFPVLEGDYTTWAIYDSFDETDTSNSTATATCLAIFNRIETIALLASQPDDILKTYTISSKTVGAAHSPIVMELGYTTSKFMASAYGTYVVIYFSSNVYIYKDGVELQSFTFTDLGIDSAKISSACISPTGKYIAVSGKRTATGNDGWVILVGS